VIDSHKFKTERILNVDKLKRPKLVRDILETKVPEIYDCGTEFQKNLLKVLHDKKLDINGVRMIDFRNGNSVHSWELGIKGECSSAEIDFMNSLIANRRKKIFGSHQDGKSLSKKQIETFFKHKDIDKIITSLLKKGYLKEQDGLFNPVSGNMSFEVFKFLDPDSISITLVSSDAHKLGIFQNGKMRRITPRECARLQGYPETFQPHHIDASAYRQFGNSVSVPVIYAITNDLFLNNPCLLRENVKAKLDLVEMD
jgi:DNA (cytosine-5)-methyltransferase 1